MRIAEVSKEYGISADTLRYYERIGLLPRVHRNETAFATTMSKTAHVSSS